MLASTTDDLNVIFRNEVADKILVATAPVDVDRLWKETEVYTYMTEAADAVARNVEGIYKLLTLPVVAGTQLVPLPRNILHVREARLLTGQVRLYPMNIDQGARMPGDDYGMQVQNQFWTMQGLPRFFVRDYNRQGILLSPIPAAADTIEMQCTSTIAVPLTSGMVLPYAEAPDQRLMLTYMKYLAYAKHDADTLDLDKSEKFMARFEADATMRKELLESYRRTPGLIEVWDGPEV